MVCEFTSDADIIGERLDGAIEPLTKPFTAVALLARVGSVLALGLGLGETVG